MKCHACSDEFPDPDIVSGTAYFVCASCGHVREIENYQIHTKEEWKEIFESENEFVLPDKYIDLAGQAGPWVTKLPPCDTETSKYYFGEGFYLIGAFADLNPYRELSIFESTGLIKEWGLPEGLVLIEGSGHAWLALDYRNGKKDPKVIVIESEKGGSLVVANSFTDFVSSLLSYDEVYDSEGKLNYGA